MPGLSLSSLTVVRPEHGTPGQRARVTEIKDGPHTRKVMRDRHGRISGVEGRSRVDDLVDVAGNLADRVDHVSDHLSGVEGDAEVLAERVQRLEGWTEVSGSGLMLNERALVEIGTRLGYDWRRQVSVRFHEPDESRSRRYGWLQNEGDRLVIHVYTGLGVNRTARCICHEMAHATQVSRIGTDYMKVYAECADELEADADTLADTVTDVELVRAAA
jgi:hypothetical protein